MPDTFDEIIDRTWGTHPVELIDSPTGLYRSTPDDNLDAVIATVAIIGVGIITVVATAGGLAVVALAKIGARLGQRILERGR